MMRPSIASLQGWLRQLVLPALSGLLLALAFPDASIFPLAWVALIPYLVFLLGRPARLDLICGHLVFCLLYLGIVLYWIGGVLVGYAGFGLLTMSLVWLLLIFTLSLFLLPFSLGVPALAGRSELAALLAAPALWVLGELLRNEFPIGGFPWGAVGYSQFPLEWLVQLADLGGVYLLSFLVVAGNCALLALIRGRHRSYAAAVGIVFLAGNLYGIWRLNQDFDVEPGLQVSLVQPVILLSRDRDYYSRVFFRELADAYRRSASEGADWVILPEGPNPFPYSHDFYYSTFWNKLAADFQVPVLLNSTTREEGGERRFNSVYLIDETGKASYRSDKYHLVPFGEYLPWGTVLGFARPLVQQVGGYTPGEAPTPGMILGRPFGTIICYEAIFPELSRTLVQKGAQLLVNVTNDHWFGETSAPRQHLEMAAFRAIENRRPIVRVANSGYSGLIDARGRVLSRTALNQQTRVRVEVHPNRSTTLFSSWGQALNVSLIMIVSMLSWRVAWTRRERISGGRLS